MVEMAGQGSPNHIIARAHNIHPDTIQTWLRRGREFDPETGDPESLDAKFHELEQDIESARAGLAGDLYKTITDTAKSGLPNTWQAAATWLERRYPDDFGRHEKRTIEGETDRPQINVLVLNDPSVRGAHQSLLSRIAGTTGGPASAGESLGPGVRGELEAGPSGE